jgi:hypothetical protein
MKSRHMRRAALALTGIAFAFASASPANAAGILMQDDFSTPNGPNGLITNQYALWTTDPAAVRSPLWEMTSGSLFSVGGLGWTGVPDGLVPDAASTNGTGSRVFRLRTREEFGSVRQAVSARINAFNPPPGGATGWDGVVLWPRYQSEFALYFAYVLRRDGRVQLTKKCAGQVPGGDYYNGGTYFPLTSVTSADPPELGRWYRLASTVRDNDDGSVSIAVYRDGALMAEATDSGVGCAPLTGPARLGVRGDNTDFNLDAYRVYGLPR